MSFVTGMRRTAMGPDLFFFVFFDSLCTLRLSFHLPARRVHVICKVQIGINARRRHLTAAQQCITTVGSLHFLVFGSFY
jgi:hypothetical protein